MKEFIKESWHNLGVHEQNIAVTGTMMVSGAMIVATWITIMVAIFSGPTKNYECSIEQSKIVHKTIKTCLTHGMSMTTCTNKAQKAHCKIIK